MEATGRGAVVTIVEAARHLGLDLDGATVAIQGFGNAGATVASLIADAGSRVVAVIRLGSAASTARPVSTSRPCAPGRPSTARVVGFPGAQPISNAALLELDVDVLVPAALESQITAENAERVRPRILAEAANGPTTPEADTILARNGVFVIPDILCNAGGVTVSYFEWVQDLNRDQWSEAIVNAKLAEIMVRSFGQVVSTAAARGRRHAPGRLPAGRRSRRLGDRPARHLPVGERPEDDGATRPRGAVPLQAGGRSSSPKPSATPARSTTSRTSSPTSSPARASTRRSSPSSVRSRSCSARGRAPPWWAC